MIAAPVPIAYVEQACRRQGPFTGRALIALLATAGVTPASPVELARVPRWMRSEPKRDRYLVDGPGPQAAGLVDAAWIMEGCLRANVPVIIVPVGSGGTAGVLKTLLFVGGHDGPRFVTMLTGVVPGHLRVDVEDGFLVESTPQDPTANCCWSHEYVRRWFMSRGRLVVRDVRVLPAPPIRREPPRPG